jgi:hypothetical protein
VGCGVVTATAGEEPVVASLACFFGELVGCGVGLFFEVCEIGAALVTLAGVFLLFITFLASGASVFAATGFFSFLGSFGGGLERNS